MTDSGSFQLSVYGEVSITNEQTLTYQRDIGSDIWVPLDIPTSPDADRETAERELAITMERLCEARELLGTEAPIAGPVQGGIYPDLRERAGKEVGELGFTFCPIGAVVPLMEAYRYRDLVNVVMAAKRTLPRSSCIHLFGAGDPVMFALAAAMGCDLFDSAAYALYAKEGRYLTTHGSFKIDELTDLPCSCVVCRSHTAEGAHGKRPDPALALHNLAVTLAEISRIRQAIMDGTLWEVVDERCRNHPGSLPATGNCSVTTHRSKCMTGSRSAVSSTRGDEECARSEVMRYQRHLARLRLGKDVLVACDAGIRDGYDDVLLFKPPFGPYPAGLKETFPIGQSEIPDWDAAMVRQGCRGIRMLAASHKESRIRVAGLGDWKAIFAEEVGNAAELIE